MTLITVIKKDLQEREVWRYSGTLRQRGANYLVLEAHFDREDMVLHDILLGKGDRFVETYYTDRWYNIFEIHDRDDDRLKGWYCNIGYPAEIEDQTLSYVDLALDLLVYPDGRQLVLDEDEFAALALTPQDRARARAALAGLQAAFRGSPPQPPSPDDSRH